MNENIVRPRWKVWEGIIAIIGILAIMFGVGYIGEFLANNIGLKNLTIIFSATVLQTFLLVAIPIFIAVKGYGHFLSDLGFIPGGFFRAFPKGIKWGLSLFFLVMILGMIITIIHPVEPDLQDFAKIILMVDSFWELLLTVVMGVVLAPIGEEVFFRGFLYPALRARLGVPGGIVLCALLFSGMHFDLYRLLPIAAGGAGLTYLYERTGNIWTNIIAHAVWNGVMIALIVGAYRGMV
ncbi:MAG: CPBP family intramembrane metalloprotease [Desulfitobacteriaceae bacterium]|nr:CPBP family intramembrane metalloprotease [Desulfitobacteriaceae bacterium]MDD4753321.1 CPBP family intramembrane metalloprotease [Desulfitobacteriaceae bacterium]